MNVPPNPPAADLATPTGKRKRKRCDNCGEWLELTKVNRRFCNTECKNEFHSHGSAFGPLKTKIETLIRKHVDTLQPAALTSLAGQLVSMAELLAADQRAIRALYSRVRVLEAAVANQTPDTKAPRGLGAAARKPGLTRRKPLRNIGYARG